jgi:hypothetical protein
MKWIRSHLSFANTISLIALFVALGGTSLAAVTLSKNSVGAKQIKKNAVQASEIKASAVGASEIRSNAVASGDIADNGVGGSDLSDNSVGAGELSDNSVGAPEIANNGVGSTEIADGTVGTGEVTDGSLVAGDLAPGTLGPTAFARINATGTLIGGADESKGVTQANIQHSAGGSAAEVAGTGVYCIGGLGFTPKSAVISTDNTDDMPAPGTLVGGDLNVIATVAIFKGEDLGYCDATHGQVRIAMERVDQTSAPTLANHGFMIQLQG